ncbi:hypothetical protein WA026_010091 [Henosepilachna vigintioctopunctata]|uniref:Uncharacterized protein n=1 Tax=Henosepilachna vigintioctopunctata TaxID=420089 RepID=A0AAW1UJB6_9CUCU
MSDKATLDYLVQLENDTLLRLKENINQVLKINGLLNKLWVKYLNPVHGKGRWRERDFIITHKLRINALPTGSRTARGREGDRNCCAGCRSIETLNRQSRVHKEKTRTTRMLPRAGTEEGV